MWTTLFSTAMAASICLSVVNLASEIHKRRDARNLPGVELRSDEIGVHQGAADLADKQVKALPKMARRRA